eukprot:gb/GEZN01004178.1/.p1 GENE.gb/GEZN01004178.1/~~gb/GEZN01004178.1/.p1  ORF type:complete len:443 (-),score=59.11 gb/GEZN01004178.1/:534-1862(-)
MSGGASHVLCEIRHGNDSVTFKIFPGVNPTALATAVRNAFLLNKDARLVLVDWEGMDVLLDGTLETGTYDLHVVHSSAESSLATLSLPRELRLDLGKEAYFPESKAVQLCPGVWSIATEHHIKSLRQLPTVNNRCLMFALRDGKTRVLLVVGCPNLAVSRFAAVHAIQRGTGLAVRYIVSQSGLHHLYLDDWANQFRSAQILIPSARIPHTANGKKLIAKWGKRIQLMDDLNPLPMFRGQLEALLFRGVTTHGDIPTPAEAGREFGNAEFQRILADPEVNDPTAMAEDDLYLFHPFSRHLWTGENLCWHWESEEAIPVQFQQLGHHAEDLGPSPLFPVAQPKIVSDCWRQIFAWDFCSFQGFHEAPGVCVTSNAKQRLLHAVVESGQLLESDLESLSSKLLPKLLGETEQPEFSIPQNSLLEANVEYDMNSVVSPSAASTAP